MADKDNPSTFSMIAAGIFLVVVFVGIVLPLLIWIVQAAWSAVLD